MKYNKGKPLTGDYILSKIHSIGKYSFVIGLLENNSDILIVEKTAIYEPDYNEIISDLIQILTITDLRIGEEVLSGDEMLEVKEKEWTILKMTDNYGKPYKQIHLTIMFDR